MKTAVLSFTPGGNRLNYKIAEAIDGVSYVDIKNVRKLTEELFYTHDALIFVGAAGIAVRAIAPLIKSKVTDPAVIVCDEAGKFVIPILSGHLGGGNALAKRLADKLNASLAITTATDVRGLWAADSWAAKNGFAVANPENIKAVSSALLKNKTVGIFSDFEIVGDLPENVDTKIHECGTAVSPYLKKPFEITLNIIPRCITLGIGCKKDARYDWLKELFDKTGLSPLSVKTVATIDIKAKEPAIIRFAQELGAELKFYSADELNDVEGEFTSSKFVMETVKTDNVCERAAAATGGELIIRKQKGNQATLAAAMDRLKISFEE